MVNKTNFDEILHVGPNFKNRKGGIASVLKLYNQNIENFRFFPSAITQNIFLNLTCFPLVLVGFILYLTFNQIETVHIHGASRGSFYRKFFFFIIAKKLFNKNVVYHIHGGKYDHFFKTSNSFIKSKVRKMIQEVDLLLVMAQNWKNYFEKNFDQKNVEILNNPVSEPSNYNKIFESKILKLLFLGKIHKEKGIFDLIETLHECKPVFGERVQLTVAGIGQDKKLKNLIEKYKLQKNVEYVGWVAGNKKNRMLVENHIMVLPSYYENFPMVLLEAMSYSMGLISSDVGGIHKILEQGQNGVFIKPGNKRSLREAIEIYLQKPQIVKEHGQNSFEKVKGFFPSKILKELSAIYKNTL